MSAHARAGRDVPRAAPPGLRSRVVSERDLDFVTHVGAGPLLEDALVDVPMELPEAGRELLRGAVILARIDCESRLEALESLLDHPICAESPPVLLKGAWSSVDLYPKPHLRAMADVDILVPPERLEAYERVMVEEGCEPDLWLPRSYYASHHHAPPYVDPRSKVRFEIHTGLFPRASAPGREPLFADRALGRHQVSGLWRGRSVQRFRDEFNLVYTAVHGAYGVTQTPFPLLDSALLLAARGAQMDWEEVESHSRDPIAAGSLALFGGLIARHRLAPIPDEARSLFERLENRTGPRSLALLRKLHERHALLGVPARHFLPISAANRIWMNHFEPESEWRRLANLPGVLLFPSGAGVRERLGNLMRRLAS